MMFCSGHANWRIGGWVAAQDVLANEERLRFVILCSKTGKGVKSKRASNGC